MDWGASVIEYCERRDAGFWSEPLNVVTNVAFLIAAASAYALLKRKQSDDAPAAALIAVTALVGLGSFTYHTMATRWAELLDVLPIAMFIYSYFLLMLRRFFGVVAVVSVALTVAFGVGNTLFATFVHGRDTLAYLPALAAIAISAGCLWVGADFVPGNRTMRRETAKRLAAASLIFVVSLSFRTMDRILCPSFPSGTHFLWHLLNAFLLWLLLRAAILAKADSVQATPSQKASVPTAA